METNFTPASMGKKALSGIPFVPIKDEGTGLKVYRKHLQDHEILPYVQDLLLDALKRIKELQEMEEMQVLGEKPASIEEALLAIKQASALFVTSSTSDYHRVTRIIERVTEALAILKYIAGDEIFLQEYVKKISA